MPPQAPMLSRRQGLAPRPCGGGPGGMCRRPPGLQPSTGTSSGCSHPNSPALPLQMTDSTMKAVVLEAYNPEEQLRLAEDWPPPVRRKGEVLVRVVATAVNRSVYKTATGFIPRFMATLPKVICGGCLSNESTACHLGSCAASFSGTQARLCCCCVLLALSLVGRSSFGQHLPSLQVPGGDLAGEVVMGDEAGTFKPGDRVFACVDGWRPEVAWGTYAELCSVPAAHLARIPEGVSYTDAAALCLTGV